MMLVLDIGIIDNPQPQLEEATNLVNDILDDNMEYLMNTYMIPEVQHAALAANVPAGFVKGVGFVRTGTNQGDIINSWGSEELPLALWFNSGTRDHGSLGNWPLHWKSKVTGKHIFAMYVRGVPKTEAMQIGMMLGRLRLKAEVPRFVERRL